MRVVDEKVKKQRKQKILQAVIHEYIRTNEPVSSRAICTRYRINLSSATVRNLMEELEKENYLTHLHTSSGRMPTDKGYRFYVDSLLRMQRDWLQEEERIRQEYRQRRQELDDLLQYTSRLLSGLSRFTGFVLAPPPEESIVKKIQLIPVGPNKLLVLVVTHTGLVRHILLDMFLSTEQVWRLNDFLNEKLSGKSLREVRESLEELIREYRREEDILGSLLGEIERYFLSVGQDVFLNSPVSLPEFRDLETMHQGLISADHYKDLLPLLRRIWQQASRETGTKVLIGQETRCPQYKDISVVSAVYRDQQRPLGVLGILGPKRMNYNQMIKLVNCVARVVSKMIEELELKIEK